ncbi:MAG: HDOD domain-containing protein [Thermodesulfobacteriota bacterium]|nr:HDOD domain-containing protein [Thermodesulfobacteriota bacterium]
MSSLIATNIRNIRQIDAPPIEFTSILSIVGDDESDMLDLIALIDKSPMLTAKILQCANSAYFGQSGEIDNVREAVIRILGLSITRSITLAFLLNDCVNADNVPNFDLYRHWFTAVVTANLAKEMTKHTQYKLNGSTIYTVGLLHNIGILALVQAFPEQMNTVFETDEHSVAIKTQKIFRMDHYQAGALLVRSWKLPKTIVEPIYFLRNIHYNGPSWQAARLIRLCSKLATIMFKKNIDTLRSYEAPSELISQPYFDKAIFNIEMQLSSLEEFSQIMSRT